MLNRLVDIIKVLDPESLILVSHAIPIFTYGYGFVTNDYQSSVEEASEN